MNLKHFVDAVRDLRAAQRAYMTVRNIATTSPGEREELGRRVAQAAAAVDALLDEITASPRSRVYAAIDSERDYQDRLTADDTRPDMVEEMSMGDILTAIDFNLGAAKREWYADSAPYEATTPFLRKIAALAVKSGEQFGMPWR